jgi:hypothetical protein
MPQSSPSAVLTVVPAAQATDCCRDYRKDAVVVPAGMGPTTSACTAPPAATVTKDACEGTSSGSVTVCADESLQAA